MTVTPKLQFLDLSHWSWPVKWDDLKLNKDLIAVGWKASQGLSNIDQYYTVARREIEARGYLFCTYHFGDASDPIKQAQHFVDVAQPDDKMKLALDWEDLRGNQMTQSGAERFITELDRLTGRVCTIYTGNTAKDLMGSGRSTILGKHPLWIPRYSANQPVPQASWSDWDIWQYAADGSGPLPNTAFGCKGSPDCNVFSKDESVVRLQWSGKILVPVPASAVVTDPAPTTPLFPPAKGGVIATRPSVVVTVTGDVDVQIVRNPKL